MGVETQIAFDTPWVVSIFAAQRNKRTERGPARAEFVLSSWFVAFQPISVH